MPLKLECLHPLKLILDLVARHAYLDHTVVFINVSCIVGIHVPSSAYKIKDCLHWVLMSHVTPVSCTAPTQLRTISKPCLNPKRGP
jgi:hypothetical protein